MAKKKPILVPYLWASRLAHAFKALLCFGINYLGTWEADFRILNVFEEIKIDSFNSKLL